MFRTSLLAAGILSWSSSGYCSLAIFMCDITPAHVKSSVILILLYVYTELHMHSLVYSVDRQVSSFNAEETYCSMTMYSTQYYAIERI